MDPRGDFYTKENIKERLSLRNFFHDLRSTGVNTSGAKPLSPQDIKLFADALDRYLAQCNMRDNELDMDTIVFSMAFNWVRFFLDHWNYFFINPDYFSMHEKFQVDCNFTDSVLNLAYFCKLSKLF